MHTTRLQLLELHQRLTGNARSLMERKNHDYSGGADALDALANFRQASNLNLCNLPQSVLVRLTDKVSRLATATHKDLQVEDEKIEDTILDLINYSVLLYAAFQEHTYREPSRKTNAEIEAMANNMAEQMKSEVASIMGIRCPIMGDLEGDANC